MSTLAHTQRIVKWMDIKVVKPTDNGKNKRKECTNQANEPVNREKAVRIEPNEANIQQQRTCMNTMHICEAGKSKNAQNKVNS